MNVRTVKVNVDSEKLNEVEAEVQNAILRLADDGFDVVSAVPITQSGFTAFVLVCGTKQAN